MSWQETTLWAVGIIVLGVPVLLLGFFVVIGIISAILTAIAKR